MQVELSIHGSFSILIKKGRQTTLMARLPPLGVYFIGTSYMCLFI